MALGRGQWELGSIVPPSDVSPSPALLVLPQHKHKKPDENRWCSSASAAARVPARIQRIGPTTDLGLVERFGCVALSIFSVLANTSTTSSSSNSESPPSSYPSPWGSGSGDWAQAYTKARHFVSQLTLLEKVNLTTGVGWQQERCVGQTGAIPRLGFRSLCLQDSPMGVRDTDLNSAFPGGTTIAATWDRGALYARGYAMGSEHRDKGVDIQLGPVAGPLGRAPEGGRNWEGFSPDPVLTGIAMAETIKGIQDAGVIACAKHYILNEQEHFRQSIEALLDGIIITDSISSNADDVTMHELYLWPFADAVRAGVGSVMCSYNQVNNSYACQNSWTLNHLLKGELDFQGFVMSDWGAQHSGVGAALAGLDMNMPGDIVLGDGISFWGANLTLAVINGSVPEWRIDDMATRIVAAWYKVGRDQTAKPINFDSWTNETVGYEHFAAQVGQTRVNEHVNVQRNHAALIRDLAARGTVLLKNERHALPLSKPAVTAVFGQDASANPAGPNACTDRGCDNATLAQGWGSGTANYPYLVTPLSAIRAQADADQTKVLAVSDDHAYADVQAAARQATAALVFVSSDSGEAYITVDTNMGDRNNLTLWYAGDELIHKVAAVCNNTIVILHTVGPVLVDAFAHHPNVTAIVWAGLPGQESGNALADVLYGRVAPAGKTPFTWGRNRTDYGTDVMYTTDVRVPQQDFVEGIFIDYRAFDRRNTTPTYEFGFGLTYTAFAYSNLQIRSTGAGAYTPTSGLTDQAPVLGQHSTNLSDYLFPASLMQVPRYIYGYLMQPNASLSSGDVNYGEDDSAYIPAGAHNHSAQPLLPAGGAPGGNVELYDVLYEVSATITNIGPKDGEEIPQLYLSLGGPTDPKVVLRGFQRLSIDAGRSTTFRVDLTRRDLSNWDVTSQNWVISAYPKTVFVGSSSRNLPLSAPLISD
ncbi:MAG: hypothetical protein M1838_001425 [Thelocarpon superellum]|nr:MAG: hypothetical protein M1838_001425 [Thelocarpon superellum]